MSENETQGAENALQGIWTQYGLERMAEWIRAGTPLVIKSAAVGSGGGSIPQVTPGRTALHEEQWRGLVNSVQLNPVDATDIMVDVIVPNDVGGFWIREWGLFDEHGQMVAVGPHDEMHKPLISSGQAAEFLERFHLPVSNAGAIQLVIAAQALATREFVAEEIETAVAEHDASKEAHGDLLEKFAEALTENLCVTLSDEEAASALPATSESTLTALLQTARNCLKWLVNALKDHAGLPSAHDATVAATAGRIILRDANGRAQAATPSAAADIATKGYVDGKVPGSGAAPKPIAAAGVGQWQVLAAAAFASFKLPSGGTWAYAGFGINVSNGASQTVGGVAAGGTTISLTAPHASFVILWRIA